MKKLLILAVVSVMALAALGVGYALWSDTITITGTVSPVPWTSRLLLRRL
jgi:hypothetical protein